MRISDWSSDVCSSDLIVPDPTADTVFYCESATRRDLGRLAAIIGLALAGDGNSLAKALQGFGGQLPDSDHRCRLAGKERPLRSCIQAVANLDEPASFGDLPQGAANSITIGRAPV